MKKFKFMETQCHTLKTNLMAVSSIKDDLVPEGKMSRREFLKLICAAGGAIMLLL